MKSGGPAVGIDALVVLVPCVYAADLTGTWKGSFDFQDRRADSAASDGHRRCRDRD